MPTLILTSVQAAFMRSMMLYVYGSSGRVCSEAVPAIGIPPDGAQAKHSQLLNELSICFVAKIKRFSSAKTSI